MKTIKTFVDVDKTFLISNTQIGRTTCSLLYVEFKKKYMQLLTFVSSLS